MQRLMTLAATAVLLCAITVSRVTAAETLGPPPEGAFSFVIIPDTQAYRGAGVKGSSPENQDPVTNPIFAAHTRWIADNLDQQSIVFVSHVGDIVDRNEPRQWEVAQRCMDVLHGNVPYGISVGNHDMTSKGDSSLFQRYFPASRFTDLNWYGGTFPASAAGPQVSGNNANSYQLFSAGGLDCLFLHLECNAPDDVLEWANQVLEAHPERLAFITSHMGWGPLHEPADNSGFAKDPKGRMQWIKIHGARGNSPEQLWNKCYRKHANLVAVFSGDQSRTQAMHASTPGDHGNLVHEILQDYGTGWLRLVRFVPAEERIDIVTFDPQTEELCPGTKIVAERSEHQYSLPFQPRRVPAK